MNRVAVAPALRREPAWLGHAFALLVLAAIAFALLTLHDDPWWPAAPRPAQWWWAVAIVTAYAGLGVTIWYRVRARSGDNAVGQHDAEPGSNRAQALLVAYASQTGFAQQVAERTADTLRGVGMHVELRALGQVDSELLARSERALFVVSTTGEGDPPDPALSFVRGVLDARNSLSGLRYAVLALGDRSYRHYCGFGHRLDQCLRQAGATPLFDLVEVDNGDDGALRHWQHHLGVLAGAPELPDWAPANYQTWRLLERRELNPGSVGTGAWHLVLQPDDATELQWQAGDIAEVGPRNAPGAVDALLTALGLRFDDVVIRDGERHALGELLSRSHLPATDAARNCDVQALASILQPLPHREYSIASLPSDGSLQLLVRRMQRPDGTPGLGSAWLCDHVPPGDAVELRIRSNANFHPPPAARPMILIGNGTGIAGLRAHLKARIVAGARRNWLIFGERNADRDFFYRDEIETWREAGWIERHDLVFSRDGGVCRYVQDALRRDPDVLRNWIDGGAVVYVCGSLQGMAPGVDAALREVLGDVRVDAMLGDGDYRRDVY